MALSTKPFQGIVVTVVTAGTAVAPNPALPDNCHTIIVLNPNAAATVYVAMVVNAAAFSVATAVAIPAGASISLGVGSATRRPVGGTGAGADVLFCDASVNGSLVNVTYVNGIAP